MISFTVTQEQEQKIKQWLEDVVDPTAIELSRQYINDDELADELTNNGTSPYCGAIGGRLTYEFTPTSLGDIVKVKDKLTGQTLDLTEYDKW